MEIRERFEWLSDGLPTIVEVRRRTLKGEGYSPGGVRVQGLAFRPAPG
jgi:hypothetical protein